MDVSCSRATEITVGSGLHYWVVVLHCVSLTSCWFVEEFIVVGEIVLGHNFSGFADTIIFSGSVLLD